MIILKPWTFPIEEPIGIENQAPSAGICNLSQVASYIETFHSDNLFHFDTLKKPYAEIVDPELQYIDQPYPIEFLRVV